MGLFGCFFAEEGDCMSGCSERANCKALLYIKYSP